MAAASGLDREPPSLGLAALVHAALIAAIWLTAVVVYAFVFEPVSEVLWMVIDLVVIAGLVTLVYGYRRVLGFGSLGAHKPIKLVAIVGFSLLCALVWHLAIRDWNMISLDETNYLATVRAGKILWSGRIPYNMRWFIPLVAGRWNFFPLDDAAALKALNFGAFVVTDAMLVLLLVRLRVRLALAFVAPVLLSCSYLGVYGASNRLVLDPSNYTMFVILFHVLLRREHWRWFPWVLLLAAFNSEKAVYWLPIFPLVALLHVERPWTRRHLLEVARQTLAYSAPTVLYMVLLALTMRGSTLEANLCFQNLHVMPFTSLGGKLTTPSVIPNNFQTMWFPFGPLTVYALLGFVSCRRWLKPIALLLIPIFIQALIACDTDRMLAYAFIVYVPFGYLYLSRFVSEVPKLISVPLFSLAVISAFVTTLFKFHSQLTFSFTTTGGARMIVSTAEVVIVGLVVFIHFVFFHDSTRPPS